ncbi:hypothetical protein QAD02_005814 [Eretmocerus hayati]|uniref:Uncharacterized protein n=1 Tax=Eretmocerus hayati TaxID=131215 RepID=A0ACC2NTZ7_9HYME|nr:hypothetical protein QAD02_005814 [Eretmocerus hayati]
MNYPGSIGYLIIIGVTFQTVHGVGSAFSEVTRKQTIPRGTRLYEKTPDGLIPSSIGWRKILHRDKRMVRDVAETRSALKYSFKGLAFSSLMQRLEESLWNLHNNHETVLGWKKLVDGKPNVNESLAALRGRTNFFLGKLDLNNPPKMIYWDIQDIFKNYDPYVIEQLLQDYRSVDVCGSKLSPQQGASKLVKDAVLLSHVYNETMVVLRLIRDKFYGLDGNGADFGNEYLLEWPNDTITAIERTLGKMSRRLYVCGLPSSPNLSIELKVFSKSYLRTCNDYDTPDEQKCYPTTQIKECPEAEVDTVCSISHRCRGTLHGCKSMSDSDTKVCTSTSLKHKRYQYYATSSSFAALNGDNGHGNYGSCRVRSLKRMEIWDYLNLVLFSIKRNGRICTSCDCTCSEGDFSINLSPVYSNVSKNMVVTGAKFAMENNVLELRVQQTELLPNGGISNVSSWVGSTTQKLQKVSWDDAKKILLSTTMIPPFQVLTGLQLDHGISHDPKYGGPYIFLRVLSSEYDYETGRVSNRKPVIGSLPAIPQVGVDLVNLTSPWKMEEVTEEFIQNDAWITLGTSNGLDGGQSTVPFFDGQEVTSGTLSPLSGAGLYYKGGKTWAGYIGIELHTYDTSRFIASALSSIVTG